MKKYDDHFKWLIENFNFIDSLTMVDQTGKVIVKERYNPRYSDKENEIDNQWCLGKNLLEVFPHLNYENSSLLKALNTGEVIYYEGQVTLNHMGKKSVTNNLTLPVIRQGKIVAAVELSRDVTHIEEEIDRTDRKRPRLFTKNGGDYGTARWTLEDIITRNKKMLDVKRTVAHIADSSSSVMVIGETGTGKELVVSAIHNASYRKSKPFIAVNCAALPESILEGLLFGSQKGAFTGAENKKGMFEEANGGTIYLDEINSMPIMLQAKLLRVLQEKAVTPLGSSKPVDLDVRVISSVNRPIKEILASGQMREDILYRLNTLSVEIPPLRDRIDDVALLAEYFNEKHSKELGKEPRRINRETLDFLVSCKWRGNVRELEHVIESAVNTSENDMEIGLDDLPIYLTEEESMEDEERETFRPPMMSLHEAMANHEKKLIIDALRNSGWKVVDAARRLGIPRTSLQYKLDKYGIKKR